MLTSISLGRSTRQRSKANGHTNEYRHPSNFGGIVTFPFLVAASNCGASFFIKFSGVTERRARVYGWSGFLKTSDVKPYSTISPLYMTATLSDNFEATETS